MVEKKHTLPTLVKRERLQLSIRFRLRANQTTGDKLRQLYVRLRVNGTTVSDYASGLYIRPALWHSPTQKLTGYSKSAQEANKELDSIAADHKRILAELNRLYLADTLPNPPTADLVKIHWVAKTPLIPTVISALNTYLTYLESLEGTPDAREKRTLDKWRNGVTYLAEYVALTHSEKLTVDLVTTVWAKGFYYFLLKRPLGQASAARFVGYLRASINHLIETRQVASNPLANYTRVRTRKFTLWKPFIWSGCGLSSVQPPPMPLCATGCY